jgi:signal transduction histidine kinase
MTAAEPATSHRLLRVASTPYRWYRERTSVQLILSHVIVALLTIILFEATVIVAVFGFFPNQILGSYNFSLDTFLGERARSYGVWLDPDRLEVTLRDGIADDEQARLTLALDRVVSGDVPGFESTIASPIFTSANRIAYAAIVDDRGIVLASSDPGWIAPGEPISRVSLDATRRVAARNLALRGNIDPEWEALYSLGVSGDTSAAAYPLVASDRAVVAHLVLQGTPLRQATNANRLELIKTIVLQNLRIIWLFAIPALLIAIPFGIWRARVLSRRLEQLALAADTMAAGKLNSQVAVRRRDEIGRATERFNEMSARLDEVDRQRKRFLSNISHELRTPVAIIQGTTERLLAQRAPANAPATPPIPAAADDWAGLQVIAREAVTLSHLIDDLSTLARLNEGRLQIERTPIRLSRIAAEGVASIRELAWKEQKVTVEAQVPPDLPEATGDPTRMRQVLQNLLYNALRHTPEGGLIVVEGAAQRETVELSVTDTGIGIPPEELDTLFERGYQSERQERVSGSTGLGLSIVRQLVESQGGTIRVASIVNQGTTFTVTLPKAR